MIQFIKSLVENCEIAVLRNESGWRFHARGALALFLAAFVGLTALLLILAR